MTKLIFNSKLGRVEIKDGRKVIASVATTLTAATLAGMLEATDPDDFEDTAALVAHLEATIATLAARKGSVVPDEYRYRYGVDQNCGDEMAKALTAKVTDPKTGVDLEACREVAAANGVEDRFDGWLVKGLNPGMVRMNLGNVLRGKLRKGDAVVGL
jgi:hypothetical protein